MIRLFDKDTIDFTTLGIGVLTDAISCEVAEKINADFEVEMEYPITGQLYNEIRNLRILYLKPNDYTDEQPFRIYSITKPIDGIVTINAQHISYDLSGYLFSPKQNDQGEYPIYTTAKAFFDDLNAGIQNGNVYPNTCPFRFECDIEEETEGIQISEIANIRKILTSAAEAFEGEYEFDGFVVRMKSNRGINRGFSVTYSKNMVELEATVNSQNSATGIFPYFKSEENKTVQGITRTWVKVYIAQNGEFPKANWLTDKAENQQAVTPVVTSQAYIVTLRPDDPASYEQYKDHIVMWRTTIENSYVIAGFTPDANGNYPYNALSAEQDSDISIEPINNHYYRTLSNSVYTYYKFNSTSNKYEKQDNEGEYEDITDQKPVFCFVNQNPTKDSSGKTIMDEHYLVDDFGRELNPVTGKVYMSSLNEMIGIINHFYRWTTEDFDDATQLWVISGKEKNQNGNYAFDALTVTQGSLIPHIPTDGEWCKIFVEESIYEYYRYSSEAGFYMRQTGTGRYKEYSKDTKFEAAPTIISTMSETKTIEHYVDLPEKIIYVNGLENQQYQKIAQVDLTEYLNDKLATRIGSTVYEYDQVTINENSTIYSSDWLDVGGTPKLDFIAQQITTADKNDENGKNFYGRLYCWNGTKYYEVYGLPRTYLMTNAEKDSDGNYSKTSFCESINSETPLDPVNDFVYKILQGVTYYYYRYKSSSEKFELMKQDDGKTPMNPSQFHEDTFLCATYKENPETHEQEVDKAYVEPRRKRILNSAEPSEQELRDAAVKYLEKNDVNVANNTFTVTFAKLSRSPEYSKWKELEHVELGDSISIIYSDLGVVQHEIEVIGLSYDVLKDKYTQVDLGTATTSLADTAVTSNDGVSVLKNDKGYTDVKKVADIIAENITANYIKAMTAEFTEAQIQQLEATRLDITEALTASQASIDEIVSKLLTADEAVIKNTLTSGEISVKGDISIESGEINLGIIAEFNSHANNIYTYDSANDRYVPVYDSSHPTVKTYYNPNTAYYVRGDGYKFMSNADNVIFERYGDDYVSVYNSGEDNYYTEYKTYYVYDNENDKYIPYPGSSEVLKNTYTELTHDKYDSINIKNDLKTYTNTSKGYRFNVANTGAMTIQNNSGDDIFVFDDKTGNLEIGGNIYAEDLVASDRLLVGADTIERASMYYTETTGLVIRDGTIELKERFKVDQNGNLYVGGINTSTASMYYNPTDGLVFNDGSINIADVFKVDTSGTVDIEKGIIRLGPTHYKWYPTITSQGYEVYENYPCIKLHVVHGNPDPDNVHVDYILPFSYKFKFSHSLSGDDLPGDYTHFTVSVTGGVTTSESPEEPYDNVIEIFGTATLEYDGQPFVNTTGRGIGFAISCRYRIREDYSGEIRDYYWSEDMYIPTGSNSLTFDRYTEHVIREGFDIYDYELTADFEDDNVTGTVNEVLEATMPANKMSNTLYVRISRGYLYNITSSSFSCDYSGQYHEDDQIPYAFEVNNEGEMSAAKGILIANDDSVRISNNFYSDSESIILGAQDNNTPTMIIDQNGLYFDGVGIEFRDGFSSDYANIKSLESGTISAESVNTETTKIGKVTLSHIEDGSDTLYITIQNTRDYVYRSWKDNTKKVFTLRAYVWCHAHPTDPMYTVANFDYSYKVHFEIVYRVRYELVVDDPLKVYIFTDRASNIYADRSPSPAVGVYIPVYDSTDPLNSLHYDPEEKYVQYDSSISDYVPITIDEENIEDYCDDDQLRDFNIILTDDRIISIPAGETGDVMFGRNRDVEEYNADSFAFHLGDPFLTEFDVTTEPENPESIVYGRKYYSSSLANATATVTEHGIISAGNGSVSLDGSIIPDTNNARDVGSEDKNFRYGYFTRIQASDYVYKINYSEYLIKPIYNHHIIITSSDTLNTITVIINYQSASRSADFDTVSDFVEHLYNNDVSNSSSLYYGGRVILTDNEVETDIVHLDCTVYTKYFRALTSCSIYVDENHDTYGLRLQYLYSKEIDIPYPSPSTQHKVHDLTQLIDQLLTDNTSIHSTKIDVLIADLSDYVTIWGTTLVAPEN